MKKDMRAWLRYRTTVSWALMQNKDREPYRPRDLEGRSNEG